MNSPHVPVLLEEVQNTFKDIDGYVVDCTVGYAGHSYALLAQNPKIKILAIDQDEQAIKFSTKKLEKFKNRVTFFNGNFSNMINKIQKYDVKGILADIGVSSLQLDDEQRGFGFKSNILDMRMNQNQKLDAQYVVNTYCKDDLEYIFKEYGEVKEYKKMASLIIENRPHKSASNLAKLIESNFTKHKKHPATLAFQAIRIEVNNELGELKNLLENIKKLNKKLRVAIISFHSLEDRLVKQTFKDWSKRCICPAQVFKCECGNNNSLGKIQTKRPIIPTKEEIRKNPRSRSSKMRIFDFE